MSLYSERARAVVGNACDLETQFPNAAGVFSLFGLQQLPDAHLALANWVRALAPGQLTPHKCHAAPASAASPLFTAAYILELLVRHQNCHIRLFKCCHCTLLQIPAY